jgi:hypothetical protein
MIEASAKLLEQVIAQQAAASRLSELSVACGAQPLVLPELDQLAEEAGLQAVLWAMQAEMRGCAAAWLQGPLFELDVADMQSQVGPLVLLLNASSTVHKPWARDTCSCSGREVLSCIMPRATQSNEAFMF